MSAIGIGPNIRSRSTDHLAVCIPLCRRRVLDGRLIEFPDFRMRIEPIHLIVHETVIRTGNWPAVGNDKNPIRLIENICERNIFPDGGTVTIGAAKRKESLIAIDRDKRLIKIVRIQVSDVVDRNIKRRESLYGLTRY